MTSIQVIYNKLNLFHKKFYINKLIKGTLLFIAIGLCYYLLIAVLEEFLWLSSVGRTFLFYFFLLVEVGLFLFFIIIPILKLFKIAKGISEADVAQIIQQHFPDQVGDKLYNLLQLHAQSKNENTELIAAAIDQKISELHPIPFTNAVQFHTNKKYLPYVLVPVLIFIFLFLTGNFYRISFAFNRVAQYNTQFLKPAPFEFVLKPANLRVKENDDFTIQFQVLGTLIPETVTVHYNKQQFLATKTSGSTFTFVFPKVKQSFSFYLSGNSHQSKLFQVNVLPTPNISEFEVHIQVPSYLSGSYPKKSTSGNLLVPEGSLLTWQITAEHADQLLFVTDTVVTLFKQNQSHFKFSKTIHSATSYQIVAKNVSNNFTQNLHYNIQVVADEFPVLQVIELPDSIAKGKRIFHGKASDDYGISKLQLVYSDVKNPANVFTHALPIQQKQATAFIYAFPDGITLQENTTYSFYFEVIDNDVVNHFKATQSGHFLHNELNQLQKEDVNLENQKQQIQTLEKSIQQNKLARNSLTELKQDVNQSGQSAFNATKSIQSALKEDLKNIQNIEQAALALTEKLSESHPDQEKANELKKRLESLQQEQEKNKKLYEDLLKYSERIAPSDLLKIVEQAKKNNRQQNRSLEQLVEQTKRFYVEQKVTQLQNKLTDLSQKQEKVSSESNESGQKQAELNQDFNNIKNELLDLKNENDLLKKPMQLPNLEVDATDTEKNMLDALEQLQKKEITQAKKNQQKVANKLKEMAQKLDDSLESNSLEQLQEDVKSLRQILKNLLSFSFSQEVTLKAFKANGEKSFHFNQLLKDEQKLKNQFKFIDDSLHTLAGRQILIQKEINTNVGEIHYNLDQSVLHLTENNLSKGISHQQYVINYANVLADLLSESLTNMQNQMTQLGSGKANPSSGEPQLSDIIVKQQEIEQKFKEHLQPGQTNPNPDGKNPDESEAEMGALLEIYKEQQRLREALQKALEQQPKPSNFVDPTAEIKKLEQNLLNKGFSEDLLNQFNNLQHQLLQLQDAVKEQGESAKREGQTNTINFSSPNTQIPKSVIDYINSTEMLQKNSLPLQNKYEELVKEYFK